VPDEPLPDRSRRRPVLLLMLVTGALLLAIAGMSIAGPSSSSGSGSSGSSGVQGTPSVAPAAGTTHRGHHCRHGEGRGGNGAPQSSSTEAPPV
jgi:hypothetical protein